MKILLWAGMVLAGIIIEYFAYDPEQNTTSEREKHLTTRKMLTSLATDLISGVLILTGVLGIIFRYIAGPQNDTWRILLIVAAVVGSFILPWLTKRVIRRCR